MVGRKAAVYLFGYNRQGIFLAFGGADEEPKFLSWADAKQLQEEISARSLYLGEAGVEYRP